MKKYEISLSDIKSNYFHFTSKYKLESIEEKGLLPKIGIHGEDLESTKKVFFVEGLDNLLILLDCWIYVCSKYPLFPRIFHLGAYLMKFKWFPKKIVNAYFKYMEINKIHKWLSYKYFDHFLKKYTLLKLDIEDICPELYQYLKKRNMDGDYYE